VSSHQPAGAHKKGFALHAGLSSLGGAGNSGIVKLLVGVGVGLGVKGMEHEGVLRMPFSVHMS
jgi:hypothetical protein